MLPRSKLIYCFYKLIKLKWNKKCSVIILITSKLTGRWKTHVKNKKIFKFTTRQRYSLDGYKLYLEITVTNFGFSRKFRQIKKRVLKLTFPKQAQRLIPDAWEDCANFCDQVIVVSRDAFIDGKPSNFLLIWKYEKISFDREGHRGYLVLQWVRCFGRSSSLMNAVRKCFGGFRAIAFILF